MSATDPEIRFGAVFDELGQVCGQLRISRACVVVDEDLSSWQLPADAGIVITHMHYRWEEVHALFLRFGAVHELHYPPSDGRPGVAFVHFTRATDGLAQGQPDPGARPSRRQTPCLGGPYQTP